MMKGKKSKSENSKIHYLRTRSVPDDAGFGHIVDTWFLGNATGRTHQRDGLTRANHVLPNDLAVVTCERQGF